MGNKETYRRIKTAYDAYWFIHNHPHQVEEDPRLPLVDKIAGTSPKMNSRKWWDGQLINNLYILYVKINPKTHKVDDKESEKNIQVEVWLETGQALYDEIQGKYIADTHDPLLDSAGATFDDALINLANRLFETYGDYTDQTD